MNTVPDEVRKHRFTVEDYHKLGEAGFFTGKPRVELIDGEIFDMAPIGPTHGSVVDQLNERCVMSVQRNAIVRVQSSIRLGDLSEPEPDICLLRRKSNFYADAIPEAQDILLIIEVADSSLRHDRDVKIPLYALHGIQEVWLLDLPHRQWLLCRKPMGNNYAEVTVVTDPGVLPVDALSEVRLDLSDLL